MKDLIFKGMKPVKGYLPEGTILVRGILTSGGVTQYGEHPFLYFHPCEWDRRYAKVRSPYSDDGISSAEVMHWELQYYVTGTSKKWESARIPFVRKNLASWHIGWWGSEYAAPIISRDAAIAEVTKRILREEVSSLLDAIQAERKRRLLNRDLTRDFVEVSFEEELLCGCGITSKDKYEYANLCKNQDRYSEKTFWEKKGVEEFFFMGVCPALYIPEEGIFWSEERVNLKKK